jgi:hypothetical protein
MKNSFEFEDTRAKFVSERYTVRKNLQKKVQALYTLCLIYTDHVCSHNFRSHKS